jgi:type IV secretory pathway TrbD component
LLGRLHSLPGSSDSRKLADRVDREISSRSHFQVCNTTGRRTHGVRPARLHGWARGVRSGLRGSDARERLRRKRRGGVAMTADRPREIVIHQSANRPNQILGGDRELVLLTLLVSVSLAFSLATLWGVGLAVGFWIGSVAVWQRMGKADPMLRQVYLRHIRYRPFYSAKSALFSRCVPHPLRWR